MNDAMNNKRSGKALKIILPILVLVIGAAGLLLLIKLKPSPQHQPPEFRGVLIDVTELRARPHQVQVHATGTVQAEQEISLVPEVSGKVSWLSPKLVDGGFFKTGETLLKIEAEDYRLAVERARAEVARAKVALLAEQERAKVARQEWQRVELPDKGKPGPLVTHEIQLQQEQANLAGAQAALEQAQLNLQRTTIRAPFNGRIRQEAVDLGQYLRAGTSIATLAGTDRAEIIIPLPLTELSWLKIPAAGSDGLGSTALIKLPGRTDSKWKGRIVRSLGEIDPGSRMATIVVAVDDPYQQTSAEKQPALSNGQFVEITLQGPVLTQVIELPRSALRENDRVWIMNDENRLHIVPVEVVRRDPEQVVAQASLADGTRLVLTAIPGAADGLLLRTAE